jgi:hypothetical protein
MENRKEPFIITALVAGMLGFGAAQPAAEADARPTLAVVSFKGPDIPPETGDAMADELAAQFVETGRYRVMPRNWLPARDPANASLPALQAAAIAANIKYLVIGEARYGMSLGAARRDVLFMDVRVVSVATGEVVRTATGRTHSALPRSRRPVLTPMGPSRGQAGILGHVAASAALAQGVRQSARAHAIRTQAGGPQIPGLPSIKVTPPPRETAGLLGHLATSVAAVHRAKHHSKAGASVGTGAWKEPIADIAKALKLPGESR